MENANLLIVAMAEKCREVIQTADGVDPALPQAVHPRHLLWMCDRIEEHAEDWPDTKLHRWIGFVQCGMLANRMLDLDALKAMFDEVYQTYGADLADQDLIDHLDPTSSFRMDLGGQG
jgi:hypothetical protein